jgi:hypothetical protein
MLGVANKTIMHRVVTLNVVAPANLTRFKSIKHANMSVMA